MKCEVIDCGETDQFDKTGPSSYEEGWRIVGSSHLEIETTSATTRLCPDHAEEFGYL